MPTVDAYRAGSWVDFFLAGCCVAPPRSSLPLSKRYLSRSSPLCMYFRCDKDSSRFGICQYNVDFQDLGLMTDSNHSSRRLSYMSYSEEGGKAPLMFAYLQLYPPLRRVQFLRGHMSQITTFMV